MPKSIFSTFRLNDPKSGNPIDLLATMRIVFDGASLSQKTLWERMLIDQLFTYNVPQLDLNADAIVGKYGVRVRASVIGNDSATPLRPGRGFEVWTGEIPRVGHKFKTSVKVVRKLLQLYENNRVNPSQKIDEIQRIMFGDYRDAYLGCKDVLDEIVLKAMSHGGVALFDPKIDNPDGRKYEVDYLLPEENKMKVDVEWTEANLTNPNIDFFGFLQKIQFEYRNKGIEFAEIWMSPSVMFWAIRSIGVRKSIFGTDKSGGVLSATRFQQELESMGFPSIRIIQRRTAFQSDGIITNLNPWNDDVITFVPRTSDGKLGEIQPALEDSVIMPDPDVDYADAGNGLLVAKWTTGESTGQQNAEYTQGTWRALPIITCMNGIVQVKVRNINTGLDVDPVVSKSSSGNAVPSALTPVETPLSDDGSTESF